MLTIRDQQMSVFGAERRADFEHRMVHYLAETRPAQFDATDANGSARALVRRTVEAGAVHGISNEGAVQCLLDLFLDYGEQFEGSLDREYAQNILRHPTLPGEAKVSGIREKLEQRTQGRQMKPVKPRSSS